jgi:hypothetical protein
MGTRDLELPDTSHRGIARSRRLRMPVFANRVCIVVSIDLDQTLIAAFRVSRVSWVDSCLTVSHSLQFCCTLSEWGDVSNDGINTVMIAKAFERFIVAIDLYPLTIDNHSFMNCWLFRRQTSHDMAEMIGKSPLIMSGCSQQEAKRLSCCSSSPIMERVLTREVVT